MTECMGRKRTTYRFRNHSEYVFPSLLPLDHDFRLRYTFICQYLNNPNLPSLTGLSFPSFLSLTTSSHHCSYAPQETGDVMLVVIVLQGLRPMACVLHSAATGVLRRHARSFRKYTNVRSTLHGSDGASRRYTSGVSWYTLGVETLPSLFVSGVRICQGHVLDAEELLPL